MNCHSWVRRICILTISTKESAVVIRWIISQVRLKETVYLSLSHPCEALNMYFHHTDTHFHFQIFWKTAINQWFLDSEGRRSQGVHRVETERMQSCCCCKTRQTGLRRAKRHSEGKMEQHWAISSQSGCTGLVGEGEGLSTATFPFLSGWQDDMSQERISFLLFSAVVIKCNNCMWIFFDALFCQLE